MNVRIFEVEQQIQKRLTIGSLGSAFECFFKFGPTSLRRLICGRFCPLGNPPSHIGKWLHLFAWQTARSLNLLGCAQVANHWKDIRCVYQQKIKINLNFCPLDQFKVPQRTMFGLFLAFRGYIYFFFYSNFVSIWPFFCSFIPNFLIYLSQSH